MQIRKWKEYTDKGVVLQLIKHRLTPLEIEEMLKLAKENTSKVILLSAIPTIGLKYEMEGGKMRWYLLE